MASHCGVGPTARSRPGSHGSPPRPSRETEEEGPAGAGPLGILLLEIIYMMTIGGLIVRQCTAPGEVAVVVAIDTALNIEHKLREMRGGWRC